jgi:hypothetical protein
MDIAVTRVLQNTGATISVTFTVDGTATDPSPAIATIGIVREDGTTLVAPATATTRTGVGVFTYQLTPTQAAQLDLLTVRWTATFSGNATVITDYVEIVGGFLFTLGYARTLKPLQDTVKYPTADVVAARTLAEMALEDACGVAFVPRYARETRTGDGTSDLLPKRPRPLSIITATLDGSTVTDAVVDDEDGPGAATFYRDGGWGTTRRGVVLKYEHGYRSPPPRVGRAAAILAKRFLVDSPLNDRAINVVSDAGTEFLVTAGVRDAVFDVPEANAVVQEYGYLGDVA